MAETLQAEATAERLIFQGKSKSMGASIAVMVAGILTFSMGFTGVFFVEAMAWTFIVWGALLLYGHIIDYATTYEVTDHSLIVRCPVRFWNIQQTMEWNNIKRLNVVVGSVEAEPEDATIQIIYTPEGSTQMIREDMPFNAALAEEVVTRAGLKAPKGSKMTRLDAIPQDAKGQYTWQ